MKKGFTLIELLIVVAIIAILAAIAVPNFLEAQIRAKVSRVRSDQRSLQVAIETYYVDNNTYPLFIQQSTGDFRNRLQGPDGSNAASVGVAGLAPSSARSFPTTVSNGLRPTFAIADLVTDPVTSELVPRFFSLTTPISYISSYFLDPFSNGGLETFTYVSDGPGWILVSYGPDADEPGSDDGVAGDLTDLVSTLHNQVTAEVVTPFNGRDIAGSRLRLQIFEDSDGVGSSGQALSYDPTNGTTSPGDLWRLKE
jgi:prepilin-type N-terminal cleavage/methylation domain-containing protein